MKMATTWWPIVTQAVTNVSLNSVRNVVTLTYFYLFKGNIITTLQIEMLNRPRKLR